MNGGSNLDIAFGRHKIARSDAGLGPGKPENLEQSIEHLSDFTIDVDNEDAKVRVFCE